MSKILSVFEKLNLVEKVPEEKADAFEKNVKNIEGVTEYENEENSSNEYEVGGEVEVAAETEVSKPNNEYNHSPAKPTLNYDHNMNIEDIYSAFGIENSSINTVFMLGNFINALPESLPYEVKKRSVMNIISASNTDLTKLLSDGEKRLSTLNKFASDYHNSTNNVIDQLNAEIIRLNSLINKYKEQIHVKETMLEEQNYTIKYEAEKINNIINFFNDLG